MATIDEKLRAALASPVGTSDESARRERIADLAEEAAFREAEEAMACLRRRRGSVIKLIRAIKGDDQPSNPCAE